jgi:hypothetical protein
VKIETVFMIAALTFMAALATIAYTTGNKCHEEPPSDKKRVEAAWPARRARLEGVDAHILIRNAQLP